MAATKSKSAKKPEHAEKNGAAAVLPSTEVLTLAEAAAYLRVAESDVLKAIHEQSLPAREIGGTWRFHQASLQDWLKSPSSQDVSQAFLDMAGKFKDDPFIEEICREAYRQRGRSITEDSQ